MKLVQIVVVLPLLCFLGSGFIPSANAKTVYVKPTGNNSNTGLSWEMAKQTVAAGLTASVSGDQVWVAAGTYNERITLKNRVALYGGFVGIETLLAERNIAANPTILDGQRNGAVVTSPYGLVAATRIDGFTIRNGTGKLSGSYRYGGGIYCDSSSPAIANNTIISNIASSGGGIFYGSYSSPTISGNIIRENNAAKGGGICCNSSSASTISGNMITGNSGSGGGIYCSYSSPVIVSNTISENTATSGGGVYCLSSSPTIANNIINSNSATDDGGGIYCDYSFPTISNNTINGNSAAANGGGICCWNHSSATISNNTIAGNIAYYNGGGICCYWYSSPTISSNTITGNINCYNGLYTGGGICCYDVSSPLIANNIIAFNDTGIYSNGFGPTPVLRNNCVFNPGGDNYMNLSAGSGDISLNPGLEACEYGKYHLSPDSPCINMGNDADVQSGQVDMDGLTRTVGPHVDIGSDEYDGTVYAFTPSIIHVSPAGSDANDGSNWASAKQTVQAGIDAAAAAGGEVWVAQGTYNERIALRAFDYLYGGFAGTETRRNQRDFKTNKTILDGQQGGSVVTATACGYQLGCIDGFTIRNGTGTLLNNYRHGGGIYCSASSLIISNNTISGNDVNFDGGGIYCSYSFPIIANNTISQNIASISGGGISCSSSSPTISNNNIEGNNANIGAGISCLDSSSPRIVNCMIIANFTYSDSVGGLYCNSSSPTIANNIIIFNATGIYNYSGTPVLRSNCVFNSIYNYSGLSAGTGDISLDPYLVNWLDGDYHLTSNSPCIDAGNDSYSQSTWLDMDGQPRINGSHVDIGADEWHLTFTVTSTVELQNYNPGSEGVSVTVVVDGGAPMTKTLNAEGKFTLPGMTAGTYSIYVKASHWLSKTQTVVVSADTSIEYSLKNGDVNDDDVIDFLDLGMMAENWLEPTPSLIDPGEDLNGDASVKLLDFAIMGANWYLEGE